MRTGLWVITFAALGYAAICLLLYFSQRALIYFPQPSALGDTSNTLFLHRPDATLEINIRPHAGSKALIYFGGNAEDVSLSLPVFSNALPEYAIYLMHYRGYGRSTGEPSEETLYRDAQALFDHVRREHADITVVGRSLGSGVATRLASTRPAKQLILITPYASIQELAASRFAYFPTRLLLTEKFESWRNAAAIRTPTLFIVAENDEVIPRTSTDKLYAHFAHGVASYTLIDGAGHNSISSDLTYIAAIQKFLKPGAPY